MALRKIKVGVLAATGTIGQRFILGLIDHPWFTLTAVAASTASVGKKYHEACAWLLGSNIPESVKNMVVAPCSPPLDCEVIFSALPSDQAQTIEPSFAQAGYKVFTNASTYRMDPVVPLLIPEVNHAHLALIQQQSTFGQGGYIVANPNCSAAIAVTALAPLHERFTIDSIVLTTMQALSGAGYPGVSALDSLDNIIPFIATEEEKMAEETKKMLGVYRNGAVTDANLRFSAHCNRVATRDGHLVTVSVKLAKPTSEKALLEAWQTWQPLKDLPTAPKYPIIIRPEPNRPQTRLDREAGNGMSVSVGRLRPCEVLDWRFVALGHNAIRGAAGGSILNAELAYQKGWL